MSGSRSTRASTRSAAPAARVKALSSPLSAYSSSSNKCKCGVEEKKRRREGCRARGQLGLARALRRRRRG